MARIDDLAEQSVLRGVGFGTLAILTAASGLVGYPVMAVEVAAVSFLLMAAILALQARAAPTRPYKRTEVWLMLEPRPSWPAPVAQRVIGTALAAALTRWAKHAAAVALLLWLLSIGMRLAG